MIATAINTDALIHGLLVIVVAAVVCGILAFLVRKAPIIDEPYKSGVAWGILAIFCIIIIVVLLQCFGVIGSGSVIAG